MAALTVNSTGDNVDSNNSVTTLREAINAANDTSVTDKHNLGAASGQADSNLNGSQLTGSIVFIDAQVADYGMLANAVESGIPVVVLEPNHDGMTQISEVLHTRRNISTVHLVAHGAPGSLQLGNSDLSLATLPDYAAQLQHWFNASASAIAAPSLLLYACSVAAGDAGAEFLEKLHHLTGANIAASAQRVGSAKLGGSWELAHQVGQVTDELAFAVAVRHSYPAVLNINFNDSSNDLTPSLATPDDLGPVGLGENIITGAITGTYESDGSFYEPDSDSDKADSFAFSVPAGLVVSQVELTTTNYSFPSFTGSLGRTFSGGLSVTDVKSNTTFSNLVEVPGGLLPGVYDYQLIVLPDRDRSDPPTPYSLNYNFKITAVNNTTPTDISLSSSGIDENSPSGSTIGSLSTADTYGWGHTYSLVSGTGSDDNGVFTIDGDQLKINTSADYETKSSYGIRVKTTDGLGAAYEEALTINVNDLEENTAPTDLALSNTAVNENVAPGTPVGNFSTTDAEGGDFTYALVTGAGDGDNSAFTIDGNQLKINTSPDYETKSSYGIRVKTTDGSGAAYEEALTINVNDLAENPTATDDTTTAYPALPKTIPVSTLLANDTDPEGNPLSITAVGNATNGKAVLKDNGTPPNKGDDFVLFTPKLGFSGTASFEYTLSDGAEGTDTGLVSVAVGKILSGGNGNDTLTGTPGNDLITGNNGNDTLTGLGGDDATLS